MNQDNRFRVWLSQYIQPLSSKRRQEITDYIRTAASPGFDYFFFVVLSGAIATLGLVNDSPAVIIGAMVVAPLMSPILGVGMGSITADAKLAQNSLSALVRGALISILLSALLTLANVYLPFVPSLSEIPHEVLTRTQPTPNDLVIALAGGLAAAYALAQPQLSAALPGVAIATALMPPLSVIGIGIALGRWDIAGGAALLFLTNAVTIAFAATLVFFLEGFSPKYKMEEGKLPRTLTVAAILTAVLLILLIFVGARSVTLAQENRLINNIVQTELQEMNDAELVELNINKTEKEIQLDLTVSSSIPPSYSDVVTLQEVLVARLDKPVSLVVNYLRSERLDPLEPPTATPTATYTSTPGPTHTLTPTPTVTATPQATATSTPSPSNTPQPPFEFRTDLTSDYNLYFTPGGEINAALTWNSIMFDLGQSQIYDGLVWLLLEDEQGHKGWYPAHYLSTLPATLTPTITPTN
ncbi:MAG: DUF389 domain-containing protein [Chloroflexota bacterium]|nr:DUF389 domain-containing protein [Chloroflexota bacterium]